MTNLYDKYLSKMTVGGVQYYIKDAEARQAINDIESSITGAMHFAGISETTLSDGSTVAKITIDGEEYEAKAGDVAIYGEMEYVFNGTKWQEFGSTGSLKALAFKDSATGSIECAGTNAASAVSFEGTSTETVLKAVNTAAVAPSFTEGEFTQGTLPSFTEGEFTQGTLPSLGEATTSAFATEGITATVNEANELLTFVAASTSNAVTAQGAFSAGTLPTKAADTFSAGTLPTKAADTFNAGSAATFDTQSVITEIGTATAAAQVFSGATVNVTVE